MRIVSSYVLFVAALVACSSSESATDGSPSAPDTDAGSSGHTTHPAGDGGSSSGEPAGDAGTDGGDTNLPSANEKEPNNGSTATEVDTMTIPGVMHGAIDPANDVDVFAITPAAGEFWEWTLAPTGADLAPHLTIFDTAPDSMNPTALAKGDAAATVTLQHFVLNDGKFVAAVRDARNVPTPAGKGGPTFGYTLTAQRKMPQPVAVMLPATKTGKLASLSSVDLYAFTLTTATGLDVVIKAARKVPASTLDSRLSIFETTSKKDIGTNDDASGSTTDSQLGGTLPAGNYVVIVENEGTNATDLSYEIDFTLR